MLGSRRHRRGNAPHTTFGLLGLGAFSALAIDVSLARVSKEQLEISAEAAALAGAGHLDGTIEGVERARRAAAEFANANYVYGGVPVEAGRVQIGQYDREGGFVPYDGSISEKDAKKLFAVKIKDHQNRAPLLIAPMTFGQTHATHRAKSTAHRPKGGPAGAVECYLPIALPDCNFPALPTVNPPPIPIAFGNALKDNVGWSHATNASAMNVRSVFENYCGEEEIALGDLIDVRNGVTSSSVGFVADILNGARHWPEPSPWPYEQLPDGPPTVRAPPHAFSTTESLVKEHAWGNVIGGPIPLVSMGGTPGSCEGTASFNGKYEITGFTWGYIYDARDGTAPEKGFMLQLDFVTPHEYGTRKDPDARGNIITPRDPPALVSD